MGGNLCLNVNLSKCYKIRYNYNVGEKGAMAGGEMEYTHTRKMEKGLLSGCNMWGFMYSFFLLTWH